MSEDRERSEPIRTATVRTTHADAGIVAAALAPDDTDSMSVAVDGDRIETRIERPTTGGPRSTVDDYVVNLRVADRVIEIADTATKTNANADTNADTDTDTNT